MISKINSLLFIYFFLQLGYFLSLGFFSVSGTFVLLGTLLVWLIYFFKFKFLRKFFNFSPTFILNLILVSSIALSLITFEPILKQSGINARPENFLQLFWAIRILLVLSLFLGLVYFYTKRQSIIFNIFILIALTLRVVMIIASPNPSIDVYDILKLGSMGLLEGHNPYTMTFTPIYAGMNPDYFAYGPGILLFLAPFVFLFGEPRFALAAANIASALILHELIKKKGFGETIPVIFLYNPVSLYVITDAWIDNAVILFFALTAFLLIIKRKENLALIFLGFAMSIKQTMILAPLFFLKWKRRQFGKLVYILGAFIAIVIPFALWSFKDFWEDTILWYIRYPIRHDGLTVNSLFFYFTNKDIPTLAFSLVWILGGLAIIKYQRSNFGQSFEALALWFFTFFLFNKLAFVNYYYFISSMILLSLAVKIALNSKR